MNKNHSTEENRSIPLLDLQKEYNYLKQELETALLQVTSGAKYILGPEVKTLEENIASYLETTHCTGVASGTDALLIALRALAIKQKGEEYFLREDEIITTPFTFTATGGAILRSGATPVFVDIEEDTFNLNPKQVEEAVTKNTVGIIPVHLYGQPCRMDQLVEIAKKHNLFILEDVAQAMGAKWKDKKAGTIGDISAFSFFPSKNLGCFGDGGMVATADQELAGLVRMLRTHGGKDKYDVEYTGYNSRLDTLQAAVLLVKLKHLDKMNQLRRKLAARYNEHLKDLKWLTLPEELSAAEHVYHQYTIRVHGGKRDLVQKALKEKGIASAVYYPLPLHKMKVFQNKSRTFGNLVKSEKACSEVLSLPMEPLLEDEEFEYVASSINELTKIVEDC